MSSCSLPEGTVHPHVDRCYLAGAADALRALADDLETRADLAESLETTEDLTYDRVARFLRNRAAAVERGGA